MSDPDRTNPMGAMRAAALVGQLGLVVVIPIVAGVLLGRWLDRLAGADGLIVAGMILLGVAVGLFAAFRLLLKEVR